MEKEEFELLVAILKGATRQLVDMLLQRFANAAREVWAAIQRAACVAYEGAYKACRSAGTYLRDALRAVKEALKELIAAAKARCTTT